MTSDRIAKEDFASNGSNIISGTVAIARLPIDADVATLSLPASTTITAAAATVLDDASVAAMLATLGGQPLDSDLTAIAALSTTAYGRAFLVLANAAAGIAALGLDADLATFALPANTTISAYGATLVDDADAATARGTLGLGTAATTAATDYQPIDSDLTAIAALSTTAFGRAFLALADAAATLSALGLDADLATFSVPASTTISAFIKTLLDDADATAARATLGAVIGTNVEAWDADLDAIAAVATTAFGRNRLATAAPADGQYFIGDSTVATGETARSSWVFGDGSDGALAYDGTTTILGMAPAGGVYTLTRDIYPSSMTLSGTAVIFTANFRIFCAGALTASANSTIHNDGAAAITTAGGLNPGIQTVADNRGGGGGNAGAAGSAGTNATRSQGGAGGAGGAATAGPGIGGGVAGGTATASPASTGGPIHHLLPTLLTTHINAGAVSTANAFQGGAGGSGGTAAAGTGVGGGGGAGGGALIVIARTINVANGVTLTLRASGGAGAQGTAGSSAGVGGGGGGGGGHILVGYGVQNTNGSGTLTLTVAGGGGGAPRGTGKTGAAGSTGTTIQLAV